MNKKIVYVSTPKCASESILSMLEEKYTILDTKLEPYTGRSYTVDEPAQGLSHPEFEDLDVFNVPFWRPTLYEHHQNGRESEPFEEHKMFSSDYYKWTVVRNPWHRLASAFEHLNRVKKACHGQEFLISFEEWCMIICNSSYPLLCNHQHPQRYLPSRMDPGIFERLTSIGSAWAPAFGEIPHVGAPFQLWPFSWMMTACDKEASVHTQRWENSSLFDRSSTSVEICPTTTMLKNIGDVPGRHIAETLFNTILDSRGGILSINEVIGKPHDMDRVVKFENLHAGIEDVCSDLGVPTWDLPHKKHGNYKNTNKSEHYESMYNDNTKLIDAVRNWYRYEVTTFGYDFGSHL